MDSNFARRIFERIPSNLKVRFCCGDTEYHGTATNLSKNGMFINIKEMTFPFASQFEVFVLLKEEILKINARVNRVIKSTGLYGGVGVELINPPRNYLEFVDNLGSASVSPEFSSIP